MGVLQMESEGRPDGTRPHGYETYYDFLLGQEFRDVEFQLTEEQCSEADREFVQFYHRRICWLALREFPRAVADADHTLALMDFCGEHSPDEKWTISHEQYRPFVLFHRTQAAALAELDRHSPEAAIQEINHGLDQLRGVFAQHDAEESSTRTSWSSGCGNSASRSATTTTWAAPAGAAAGRGGRRTVRAGGPLAGRIGPPPRQPAAVHTAFSPPSRAFSPPSPSLMRLGTDGKLCGSDDRTRQPRNVTAQGT